MRLSDRICETLDIWFEFSESRIKGALRMATCMVILTILLIAMFMIFVLAPIILVIMVYFLIMFGLSYWVGYLIGKEQEESGDTLDAFCFSEEEID